MRNKVVSRYGDNTKHILINHMPSAAVGVIVDERGVVPDSQGRKIIPAGTPVGGAINALQEEQAVLSVTNTISTAENTQGILLHEVDVTQGADNATMLIHGFVNENRFDSKLIVIDEVKAVLDGKVTFLRRNQ